MTQRNYEPLAASLREAGSIALVSHISPDGDTVGSVLALMIGLERMGKTVVPFCRDKIPDNLQMLQGIGCYRAPETLAEDEHFDLVMSVDVADLGRMGSCDQLLAHAAHTAQIDHHGTNSFFMEMNLVDGHASATACMVYGLLLSLGIVIDEPIAECLYTGMSTDTGNFSFANTTPEVFEIMAELLKCGLPLADLSRVLFRERDGAQLRLIGRAIDSLRLFHNGEVAVMTLSNRDFEECCALQEHADTIVNYGLEIIGVKMAVLARETPLGNTKLSLRAVAPHVVSGVARNLGGGGHAQASGASITDGSTLQEAAVRVAQALCDALDAQQAAQ